MSRPQDGPTDAAAVAACAAGDGEALAVLHRRYGGFCLAHATALLRDPQMAEDAVQEAYLDLWRQAERFDGRSSSVRSWLLMLTHRRAVDRVRAEHRRSALQLEPGDDRKDEAAGPDLRAISAHLGAHVCSAIARLSHVQREVLVLSYWGGYTQREIALMTGAPLGTVKSRMLDGMKHLRAGLTAHGLAPETIDAR